MASPDQSEKTVSFKDTLNLPQTDFPMQAQAKIEDPIMLKRWEDEKLSSTTYTHNEGKTTYILHDGPPYANGHIHLGHAYNKVLKDIVTKSQRMQGKHVPVKPGWDCHGLPIELKVSQEKTYATPQELIKACRAYAQHWIEVQKEEFKKLGIQMDWDNPYLTMAFDYEASILRAFGRFVAQGYIERKNKTVPWCASCQTVLASAEIEYQDRKDPSLYVAFPLTEQTIAQALPKLTGKSVNFLVWTTTPWTLPLNRAVLLRPDTEYAVILVNDNYYIVASSLADKISAMLGVEKNVIQQFSSSDLYAVGPQAHHPFIDSLVVPVLLDDSVMLGDGTACVHSAPGCGPEDYEVGVRNNLEIFSPLSTDGKYTVGIKPEELVGMSITDGQIWVIKQLAARGRLVHKQSITHSYPHCWRCHQGLMFRATKQWFCDLAKGNLKTKAIQAVDTITMLPETSDARFKATMEGRLEWCLSRQRVWGTPIPAFMCKTCDYTYITQELIEKVAERVAQQGIEYWGAVQSQELMPHGFVCPQCKGAEFAKEQDILDVWFDSGVSHYAVLIKEHVGFPASIYLEGKDQHRGWFQSSWLTGLVLENTPPMKMIATHGFTVDEKGRKMSKSIGNVVSPAQIIETLGTDGLRLWAASTDMAGEAVVSDVLMRNVKEVHRKIRNTCRFLLSNIYDFDIAQDAVALEDMLAIDRAALEQAYAFNNELIANYNALDFTAIFHQLAQYCAVDLSAYYLDIIKDRLYVERAQSKERRSAQTACWYILDMLTKAMAPIVSFTAEQVSDHYQKDKKHSIHLQNFAWIDAGYGHGLTPAMLQQTDERAAQWRTLKDLRSAILKAIEGLREQGIVKHSLEARVQLFMDGVLRKQLQSFFDALAGQTEQEFLKEFCIVSQLEVMPSAQDLQASEHKNLFILVSQAQGDKCPRCWHWEVSMHEHKLCMRCQGVLK
jgi:isoleucyl-tRNA synthetase